MLGIATCRSPDFSNTSAFKQKFREYFHPLKMFTNTAESGPLSQFPVATVTNYHKHGGLRQHKFLVYGSGDQKCKMGFTELESRGR